MYILTTFLYLLFVVAPIGTFIHEGGHALGARFVKADYISLSIGLGHKIKTFTLKWMHIHIHQLFFLGGSVQSQRHKPFEPREWMIITLGGPLNNAIFAYIFYLINQLYSHQSLSLLFAFNLWLAAVNALPFKFKGRKSDGYSFLQTFINMYKRH